MLVYWAWHAVCTCQRKSSLPHEADMMGHLELSSYIFYSAYIRALSAEEREEISDALTSAPVARTLSHLVGIAVFATVVGLALVRWI